MSSYDLLVQEFEHNLRTHLNTLLKDIPPSLLQLKLKDFLKLSRIPIKGNVNMPSAPISQTPKRRAVGRTPHRSQPYSDANAVASSKVSTPLPRSSLNTAFPLLPETPSIRPSTSQPTPRLTIKSSVHRSQLQQPSALPPVSGIKITKSRQTPARSVTKTPLNFTTSKTRTLPIAATASKTVAVNTMALDYDDDDDKGIVQFQLKDGKVVDVDFSRSPQSALQSANLLGSDAIGEVKAKIETYATQFMQYLKFFKKLKP